MANSLDPDQALHFVGPDLFPNSLQRNDLTDITPFIGPDKLHDTSRQRITWAKVPNFQNPEL